MSGFKKMRLILNLMEYIFIEIIVFIEIENYYVILTSTWLTSNSLKLNPTKTEAIFLHLPLRSSTLPEPPPYHLTTPHSPTLNTSETLASILIPPFPLTPILYICTNPYTTTYIASA